LKKFDQRKYHVDFFLFFKKAYILFVISFVTKYTAINNFVFLVYIE